MTLDHSLESRAQIAIHRHEVRQMPEADVRAMADSLVVQLHDQSALLRSAMRRIAELEVKQALVNAEAAAASLRPKQSKLHALLDWFARWRLRVM